MAWTTPTQRNTGDLITASIWNTDIKDNLRYLKGMDGQVTIEDDLIPNDATLTIGQSANPFAEGHFFDLYAGARYSVHRHVREIVLNWDDIAEVNYEIAITKAGTGDMNQDGTGQVVLQVDDDGVGSVYFEPLTETNGQDVSFNASRYPYICILFAINNSDVATDVCMGWRQTPGNALPDNAAENFAVFRWNGGSWNFVIGDGGGDGDASIAQTVTANTRYCVEIYVNGANNVEVWKDGSLIDTLTTGLPTGDLEFSVLLVSDGGGGAGDVTYLTVGQMIMQEALA